MNKRPGPLPFNDILDLVDELPAAPEGSSCSGSSDPANAEQGLQAPASGGMMASTAAWLARWQGRERPLLRRPVLAVFAAAHAPVAVAASGEDIALIEALVGAAQQQEALVCRLCDRFGLGLRVFELAPELPVRDFTSGAAMEEADCAATIAYGMEATAGGADLLAVRAAAAGHGAAVAAMAACLLGPRDGGPLLTVARAAHERHASHADAPLEVLRRMGGRETAAVAGAIIAARMQQVPVIVDGSGAMVAALLLERLRPGAAGHCMVAADDGHPDYARLCAALGRPVLLAGCHPETDGSAGALAAGLVQTAVEMNAAPQR
ncbi:MAG: nicotinate-nucleotide--dimethylbenzimidazole phosphoribosyltransferase [Anderseniella sp.]|jgi:nicotinate-nucleotide--dimethylbenzimidazole phosphoribosyltransferase|nr:nicotinate-nucleotide--dimethylbenzimidazole phosphoribosyltransferase [Anderseniella sp.]